MKIVQSRRDFLASVSLAAAAGILGGRGNKIIAEGTDWRFLNQLKRELKA